MTSFDAIYHFFENPFVDLVFMVINVYCFYSILSKAEMSRKLTVIPLLPYLSGMGINLWVWSQVNWSTHVPINTFGVLEPVNVVMSEVSASSAPVIPFVTHFSIPFWLEFLIYFALVSLIVNWAMYMYICIARWPVLTAKQDLEAAVGRQSGRQSGDRSSAFVGESGLDASAPVAALLNRPPRSAYDSERVGGAAYAGKRASSDAQRVADLQRQVQSGPTPGSPTSAGPGGPSRAPAGDAARVAELISSLQPVPPPGTPAPPSAPTLATAATAHCTVCGAQLAGGSQHACPLAGGQAMFCGRCGTSHDHTAVTCAHCGTPL